MALNTTTRQQLIGKTEVEQLVGLKACGVAEKERKVRYLRCLLHPNTMLGVGQLRDLASLILP